MVRDADGTIRWGILGTGTVARHFARGLRTVPDAELFAVGSRTRSNAEAFARSFGVRRIHVGYEALVDNKEADIVYIATPAAFHRDHCLLALAAGKPVLCEKPFSTTAVEAREVVAAARLGGLFCMEAMWTRFLPIMERLRLLLDRNTAGDIRLVSLSLGAVHEPGSGALDPQLGGGAFLDLGVYLVSMASFVLGAPAYVTADAVVGSTAVDETSVALLRYAGGKLAVLTASLRADLPGQGLIVGTAGHIDIHPPLYRPHGLTIRTSAPPRKRDDRPSMADKLSARVFESRLLRSVYFQIQGPLGVMSRRGQTVVAPFTGNGYNYQAAEVNRCLKAGAVESPRMRLDETVEIMETMDRIRACWAASSPHP